MAPTPKVSYTYAISLVVSPSDGPELLAKSLKSLEIQSVYPDEIVLLKNGLLSPIQELIIEDFFSRILYKKLILLSNITLDFGDALNKCISQVSSTYLIRHDPDDISLPNRVEKLKEFSKKSDVDIIHSSILEFNRKTGFMRKSGSGLDANHFRNFIIRNPIAHSSVMFKVSKILEVGGYTNVRFAEDYYLWLKVLKLNTSFGFINEALVIFDFTNVLHKRTSIKILQSELRIMLLKVRLKPSLFIFSLLSLFLRVLFLISPNFIKSLIYKGGEILNASQKDQYLKLEGLDLIQSLENFSEKIKISVIIPHYNRINSLIEAVTSIKNQSYVGKVEIVIVDDKSDLLIRNQLMALEGDEINLIFTETNSGGPAKPRNVGISESSGQIIAFLDSDDTWHQDHLKNSIPFVLNGIPYANSSNKYLIKSGKSFNSLIIRNQIITSSVVVPRNLISEPNLFPYSKEHSVYEDYVAWLKISYLKNFCTPKNRTVNYENSSSDSYRKKYQDDLTCIKSSFESLKVWLNASSRSLSSFTVILMKLRIISIIIIKLLRQLFNGK
jgi:glycosyltransferase involved in cell wall biosynthesis